MKTENDTIAAIATPVGQGGIGIIRISGPRALPIAKKIFKPYRPVKNFQTHHLYLGQLLEPGTGRMIDEVLLSYMEAPHSYTTEDVVEINSHSGFVLLSRILQLVVEQGARLARPGEFTLRAFLNGRIDLTQAEAIVDLINSRSEKGLHLASEQIRGTFKQTICDLSERLKQVLALVEAAIDFPEEDDVIFQEGQIIETLSKDLIPSIKTLLAAHEEKKIWIDGIRTVIVGKVNVGKSSLLNRLLDETRAIVTATPGTTRDIIESTINIRGIPLRLMDTAGIRSEADEIEKIGIHFTEQKLKEADLVLMVVDQSRDLNQDDMRILDLVREKLALVVINKIDLSSGLPSNVEQTIFSGFPAVRISALTGEGIEKLKDAIAAFLLKEAGEDVRPSLAPNIRQAGSLQNAKNHLENALTSIIEHMPLDIIAEDLKTALNALGEITGEALSEDILDRIFSQFCIGK